MVTRGNYAEPPLKPINRLSSRLANLDASTGIELEVRFGIPEGLLGWVGKKRVEFA